MVTKLISPSGLRLMGAVEKWNREHGFGFIVVPRTDEHVYVHARDLTFDEKLMGLGLTVEFTALDPNQRAMKVGKPDERRAGRVTLTEKPLTVELTTYVLMVNDGYGLLHEPAGVWGKNIFFTRFTAPNVSRDQAVRAWVIDGPKGRRAVKIESVS